MPRIPSLALCLKSITWTCQGVDLTNDEQNTLARCLGLPRLPVINCENQSISNVFTFHTDTSSKASFYHGQVGSLKVAVKVFKYELNDGTIFEALIYKWVTKLYVQGASPNILPLLAALPVCDGSKLVGRNIGFIGGAVVTPWAETGLGDASIRDLNDYLIKAFYNEDLELSVLRYVFMVLFTVEALSRSGMNHNDLHPGNVLFDRRYPGEFPVPCYVVDNYKVFMETKATVRIFDYDWATTVSTENDTVPIFGQRLDTHSRMYARWKDHAKFFCEIMHMTQNRVRNRLYAMVHPTQDGSWMRANPGELPGLDFFTSKIEPRCQARVVEEAKVLTSTVHMHKLLPNLAQYLSRETQYAEAAFQYQKSLAVNRAMLNTFRLE